MAVLFAAIFASVILSLRASTEHPPVLLCPVLEHYRVAEGSEATLQCTFGFPGSIFRAYRKAGATLVEMKNFTIAEKQSTGTALSCKAIIQGLPVGVNNIILRTSTKEGNHADCNAEVEVLPTSAIPELMATRLDSGGLRRYHMACILTRSIHMLSGIVTFEHFINKKKIYSCSKVYNRFYSGTISDDMFTRPFEGQYSCIAKVWVSTNQSSCIQRPLILSAALGALPRGFLLQPSYVTPTPIYPLHYETLTTTAVVTKTETVLETSTVSQTCPDSRASVEWTAPINGSRNVLTGSCLKTSMVTETVLETATVSKMRCPKSKANAEWITSIHGSWNPLTGSCLKTRMVTETVLETATVSQTWCPDSRENVEWNVLANCSPTPVTDSRLKMDIAVVFIILIVLIFIL